MKRILFHLLLTSVIFLCAANLFAAGYLKCAKGDNWHSPDKLQHYEAGFVISTAIESFMSLSKDSTRGECRFYGGVAAMMAGVGKEVLDVLPAEQGCKRHFCYKDLTAVSAGVLTSIGLSYVLWGSDSRVVYVDFSTPKAPRVSVKKKF